ncbi:MAG: transporter, partial [Ruminococcus sp.]|nr:transporter [Ruminococcus sp.]
HNTLLLEDLDPKSAYVIYSDYNGNKEARCISDYDIRIQTSHNSRRLYLNGVFGGIPYNSDIYYSQDIYNFVNVED